MVLAVGRSNGAILELFVDLLNLIQIPSVRMPYWMVWCLIRYSSSILDRGRLCTTVKAFQGAGLVYGVLGEAREMTAGIPNPGSGGVPLFPRVPDLQNRHRSGPTLGRARGKDRRSHL